MNTLPRPKSDTQHTMFALIGHGSLTSIELRKITKSSYPPARIKDCKKAGLTIISKSEKYVNRRGEKSHVSRYFLLTKIKEATRIYKQLVKG